VASSTGLLDRLPKCYYPIFFFFLLKPLIVIIFYVILLSAVDLSAKTGKVAEMLISSTILAISALYRVIYRQFL